MRWSDLFLAGLAGSTLLLLILERARKPTADSGSDGTGGADIPD